MKKQLTPAGQLAKAQVPPEEQPYALPKGWKWVRLGGIAELSKEKCDTFQVDDKYVGLEHMEKNGGAIDFGSAEGILSTKSVFHVGDVLYGKLRPYLNKHGIADFDGVCSTDVLVFKTSTFADKRWLNWSFDRLDFIRYAVENSKGVNLPRVSAKEVLQARVPLPPMEEQQRIVQRIESLFAKLDAAEVRLNAVAASFAPRKDALLHQAFTGELLHKQLQETMPMDDILADVRIGPFGSALHKQDYHEGGIPVINPKHIVALQIKPEAKVSISATKADELSAYKLQENDIIMGRRGEMGRCAPVGEYETGWLCGTGSMILRLKDGYDAKFYAQIISSQTCKQYLEMHAVGSTMKNLNERIVRGIPIPKFSPSEQRAIVAQLDHLLSREHQAAVAVTRARTELRRLRAAILARAFRGEL